MHIIISGVHVDITEAMRTYAEDKLQSVEKLIKRDDSSASLTLELSKTSNHHVHGDFFLAEAMLHIRGKDMTLKATEDNMYKAIDVVKDKLLRELSSYKDKELSIIRRAQAKIKSLLKNNNE
ncbi:MAG: hypothetical protein RI935_27 [Candidatus Parcubacteria bacterium]|jgi:putative sigma-54 modulation protein